LRCGDRGNNAKLWSYARRGPERQPRYKRFHQERQPNAHPPRGDKVRALRELRRQFPDSAFVFATERAGPFAAPFKDFWR
jgi:hypothetical protein